MARKIIRKPFVQKPFAPGARIEWTQFGDNGTTVNRAGTIWSEGPKPPSNTRGFWVIPDTPDSRDGYTAVYVVAHVRMGVAYSSWRESAFEHQMTIRARPEAMTAQARHGAGVAS